MWLLVQLVFFRAANYQAWLNVLPNDPPQFSHRPPHSKVWDPGSTKRLDCGAPEVVPCDTTPPVLDDDCSVRAHVLWGAGPQISLVCVGYVSQNHAGVGGGRGSESPSGARKTCVEAAADFKEETQECGPARKMATMRWMGGSLTPPFACSGPVGAVHGQFLKSGEETKLAKMVSIHLQTAADAESVGRRVRCRGDPVRGLENRSRE